MARQPETLATFAAAARGDGMKPDHIGLEATPETEPLPINSKEDDAATKVLRDRVLKIDQSADNAIAGLPDRTQNL
jgi:hypothetical protein